MSFEIRSGEIYGLIGPNGAGKTSLFNVLTGIYDADGGTFVFDGRPLAGLKPNDVAARGIARTFQNIRLFANLSALENVMIGRHVRTRAGVFGAMLRNRRTRDEERAIEKRAFQLLEYVGVSRRANDLAKHLPYGDQRRLEIARALATDPKLLALDEPAAGMNATETASLSKLLQRHPRRRHDDPPDRARHEAGDEPVRSRARARLRQEDRRGSRGGGAEGSRGHRRVSRRRRRAEPERASAQPEQWPRRRCPPLLAVEKLAVSYGGIRAVKGIDLHVNPRELVCLIGANGAGKTTTLKGICGLQPVSGGAVLYDGDDVTGRPAFELVRRGLAMVPEGRGVFGALSIEENLAMGAYTRTDRAWRRVGYRTRVHAVPAACASAGSRRQERCRAASSRCSRWAAR